MNLAWDTQTQRFVSNVVKDIQANNLVKYRTIFGVTISILYCNLSAKFINETSTWYQSDWNISTNQCRAFGILQGFTIRRFMRYWNDLLLKGIWCLSTEANRLDWNIPVPCFHYNDFIMSAMASQITSLAIVYWSVFFRAQIKETSKLRVTGLFAGNSPVSGEFPTQWTSDAKNVTIKWWRHHVKASHCN